MPLKLASFGFLLLFWRWLRLWWWCPVYVPVCAHLTMAFNNRRSSRLLLEVSRRLLGIYTLSRCIRDAVCRLSLAHIRWLFLYFFFLLCLLVFSVLSFFLNSSHSSVWLLFYYCIILFALFLLFFLFAPAMHQCVHYSPACVCGIVWICLSVCSECFFLLQRAFFSLQPSGHLSYCWNCRWIMRLSFKILPHYLHTLFWRVCSWPLKCIRTIVQVNPRQKVCGWLLGAPFLWQRQKLCDYSCCALWFGGDEWCPGHNRSWGCCLPFSSSVCVVFHFSPE